MILRMVGVVVFVACKGPEEKPVAATNPDAGPPTPSVPSADDKARAGFTLWDGGGDAGAKDQPGAKKVFDETCAAGSQLGCTGLALTYLDGVKGTGKDFKKALALLQPACDAKVARACSALGNMYVFGWGATKDEAKAADLYKVACDGGEPRGCLRLATFYQAAAGGLPQDDKQGFALYKRACEAGVPDGCTGLANDYLMGWGTTKSPSDAATFGQRACDGGSAEGCKVLAGLYDDGTGVAKDRKKARELLAKSCELGSGAGCAMYAGMLLRDGSVADRTAALQAFGKSCDADNADGCYGLATSERHGWGTTANPITADTHLKRACDLGSASACREYRR